MNDNSLSSLYRRMTASAPLSGIDADAIADAPSPGAAEFVAGSARLADLGRMLGALRPASEALASALHDADSSIEPRQPHRRIATRHATAPRHARRRARAARWAASIAACLVVALFATSQRETGMPTAGVARPRVAALKKEGDRIFTSEDRIFAATDMNVPNTKPSRDRRDNDQVFRASFSGG